MSIFYLLLYCNIYIYILLKAHIHFIPIKIRLKFIYHYLLLLQGFIIHLHYANFKQSYTQFFFLRNLKYNLISCINIHNELYHLIKIKYL